MSETEKSEQELEAEKLVRELSQEAQKDLDKLDMSHSFETLSECKDKDGEPTKVLRIELDKKGFLGMFVKLGQPVTIGVDGLVFNDTKIFAYTKFMSNINLDSEKNLEAIGMRALGKGRSIVTDFFTLRQAADMSKD